MGKNVKLPYKVVYMEKELFSTALGITEPVYIEKIMFDSDAGELHIHMDFRPGGRFSCSGCTETECIRPQ